MQMPAAESKQNKTKQVATLASSTPHSPTSHPSQHRTERGPELNIKRDRASNRRSCDERRSALAGYRAPWG